MNSQKSFLGLERCKTFPSFFCRGSRCVDSRLILGILQISLSSQSVSAPDLPAADKMMDWTLVAKITEVKILTMINDHHDQVTFDNDDHDNHGGDIFDHDQMLM